MRLKLFLKQNLVRKKQHEAWRYLSYCLVHHSWSHMVINLALQLLVGLLLEFVHKWYRVAPIYILGVSHRSQVVNCDSQDP